MGAGLIFPQGCFNDLGSPAVPSSFLSQCCCELLGHVLNHCSVLSSPRETQGNLVGFLFDVQEPRLQRTQVCPSTESCLKNLSGQWKWKLGST